MDTIQPVGGKIRECQNLSGSLLCRLTLSLSSFQVLIEAVEATWQMNRGKASALVNWDLFNGFEQVKVYDYLNPLSERHMHLSFHLGLDQQHRWENLGGCAFSVGVSLSKLQKWISRFTAVEYSE